MAVWSGPGKEKTINLTCHTGKPFSALVDFEFSLLTVSAPLSVSDYIGRKPSFYLYTAGSVPLYFALPYFAHDVAINHNMSSLVGFYASSMLIISFFGGMYRWVART